MELNICHLYPDILNLYGDRGNIITMKRRLAARGIGVHIYECSIGQPLDIDKYDIFFIGGGQDFEQEVLLRDLAAGKARDIRNAVEENKVFLAICGGYQMLGQYYKTWDGNQLDFIGAINIHTIGAKERMIGNYMYRLTPESSGSIVVGFENHSAKPTSAQMSRRSAWYSRAMATTAKTRPRAHAIKTYSPPTHMVRCCPKTPCWPILSCKPRCATNMAAPSRFRHSTTRSKTARTIIWKNACAKAELKMPALLGAGVLLSPSSIAAQRGVLFPARICYNKVVTSWRRDAVRYADGRTRQTDLEKHL